MVENNNFFFELEGLADMAIGTNHRTSRNYRVPLQPAADAAAGIDQAIQHWPPPMGGSITRSGRVVPVSPAGCHVG
jgi:hypothetical protein